MSSAPVNPGPASLGHDPDPARAWASIRARLAHEFGQRTFDSWLRPLSFAGLDHTAAGATVRLTLPSRFMTDWVRGHFAERLHQAWAAALPGVAAVRIDHAGAPAEAAAEPEAPEALVGPPAATPDPAPGGIVLEQRYRFETFVVGKPNELAFNAAQTMAAPGTAGFNPLFLHGPTGLGKTHLMHAIGHATREANPNARIAYMSAEKFMVEFLAAMRARDTISFKQRLRSCDLLMVDDVQFIAGKESTQEEFFHTMNEVIGAGKRLVITADRSPQNLEGIESRILSRLSWGLVADINPADYELRLNILTAKLQAQPHAHVPAEVLDFLARNIVANVRELEGALNRVTAYANLTGRAVTLEFTREVLADLLRAHGRKLTIDDIQRRVADHFMLKRDDLLGERRSRDVARPRQVAMFLAKELTQRSLPEIGRRFGGRDHTTVMHAVKKIKELRVTDQELDRDIQLIQRKLDG